MSSPIAIAPSILSADFGHLADEIRAVDEGGADWIHIDVVDGHFAPYLSFGPRAVSAAKAATQLPLDVHLMIDNPDQYVEQFARAGASHITVHPEVCADPAETLRRIRSFGAKPGIALSPKTPIETVRPLLEEVDLVLALCVEPGRSGQKFLANQLQKVRQLGELLATSTRPIVLEVDGGVTAANCAELVSAGARVLVSGSQIFDSNDRAAAISALRLAGTQGLTGLRS